MNKFFYYLFLIVASFDLFSAERVLFHSPSIKNLTFDEYMGYLYETYPDDYLFIQTITSETQLLKLLESSDGFPLDKSGNDKVVAHDNDEHFRKDEGNSPEFFCRWDECNDKFENKSDFFKHVKTIHLKPLSASAKHHPCLWREPAGKCTYAGTQKNNLTSHVRTHTGEKPFKCVKCCREFSTSLSLKRHTEKNVCEKPKENKKKIICPKCDQSFATNSSRDRHINNNICDKQKK